VRQVFNEARRRKVFNGENPANLVRFPRADNRRQRFFTKEEADALLAELAKTDPEAWEMALLSLHTGLRAGEIFSLCWGDIDPERGTLFIKDTKSGRNRFAYMTGPVREMLLAKTPGKAGELVFPGRGGVVRPAAPRSVRKAINALGLNKGRADRREKAVFHTFRHTHASWLVQAGIGLYAVKEALGHATTAMAARYSHLAPENLQQVARVFEAIASKPAAEAPAAAPAAGEGGAK
jgi:integrase